MGNLITGRVDNIAHLMGNERFTFVRYNIYDYLHIDGTLNAVMHFASPASSQDYLEYPIETLKWGFRRPQGIGVGKSKEGKVSPGKYLRGLRRSACKPTIRVLLGECESDKSTRGLLRSQAIW